jgi:hypothetical protein
VTASPSLPVLVAPLTFEGAWADTGTTGANLAGVC